MPDAVPDPDATCAGIFADVLAESVRELAARLVAFLSLCTSSRDRS